tara:strand:- start:1197 stop:1643 length:447 start_codon:yes stop_codon:yes gene_type:complete
MVYKGRYRVKNSRKYRGDPTKVIYRSSWERAVFRYLDANDDILEWNSESFVIPYVCRTDNRRHRYFVDIYLKHRNGLKLLVEIKPKFQTVPPKKPKRQTKKYLNEVKVYAKNISKWEAAQKWAINRGYKFQIWTEDTLDSLGVKILKG